MPTAEKLVETWGYFRLLQRLRSDRRQPLIVEELETTCDHLFASETFVEDFKLLCTDELSLEDFQLNCPQEESAARRAFTGSAEFIKDWLTDLEVVLFGESESQ